MNRKIKFLSLVVLLALCLSVFTAVTAFADDESYDTTPAESDTYEETSEDTTPIETDSQEEPEPDTTPVETTTAYYEEPETKATTQAYNEPEDDYTEQNTTYYNYEERETNTAASRAETAAVFDVEDDNVSTDTLKKGDWAKIAEQLKNASDDGGDDFAFIRNNDAFGGNNGEWMLILGIMMEAAGIAIVTALIILKYRSKKAIRSGNFKDRGGERPAPSRGERPAQSRGERPVRAERSAQSARRAAPAARSQRSASRRQRSKFDTAEISVPRHVRESDGKRYRPKH